MNTVDVVSEAEQVIKKLSTGIIIDGKKVSMLSKSQIRKFLAAFTSVTNKVEIEKRKNPAKEEMSAQLSAEIKFLKVKLVYQAGREKSVKAFVNESHLLDKIDGVGKSFAKYKELANYMEALVAYHKFYGGKDQ